MASAKDERLLGAVLASDSFAALLVEAERRMVEARFMVRDANIELSVGSLLERINDAVAVLDMGIGEIRAALGTNQASDE